MLSFREENENITLILEQTDRLRKYKKINTGTRAAGQSNK